MKIKQKIIELFNKIKTSIQVFPVTIICIMILTAIYAINLNNGFLSNNILGKISLFTLIFVIGTFLIETLAKEKNKFRIAGYIVSAVIAFAFTYLITEIDNGILGMTYDIFEFRLERVFFCYLIVIFTLSVYFNYKNSKQSPSKYLTNIFINMFKVSLIYGIFAVGIAAVLGTFIFLILDGSSYMLIARVEILLIGFYYVPALLYVFYKQEEVGKFGKIVIKYVLDTLVMAAFVVIYMYIIKIIILRDMPSNQIFRILTSLFVIGMPIWTMAMSFDEDKLFDKINRKLPLLFIPFIILQIYTIALRINENGITPLRYICVMLIIFEVIYIGIYLKNKEKVADILFVFIAMAIISSIVPYVNMFYISDVSQYNRFKENYYNNSGEYTKNEKDNIYGAYKYLMNTSVEGYKYLTNLTEEEENKIKEFKNNTITTIDTNYVSFYASEDIEYIDTAEYKGLYKLEKSNYNGNITLAEFNNLSFELQNSDGDDIKIEIDLSSLINLYIENEEDFDEYFENNNELKIDENRKIILESISLKYDYGTEEIDYYNLSGYLLEK